ncbi:MAG TPA: PilN domain-containing protein [Bryobacteraceae bacterium]
MPLPTVISKDVRKLLAFGTGVGIEIGANDIEVVAARVRPSRIQVMGRLTIKDYATRPAAQWGAEYTRFLKSLGVGYLAATVLLLRREVIVRHVALPGVAAKDVEGAIRLQLDTLHPYGEDDVAWGWSPLAYGAVLVGIVRRGAIDRYVQLFVEAGIPVASFTFSAAAVHAAIRLNGAAHLNGGFLAMGRSAAGGVEVYGESTARPVFSAELDVAAPRAAAMALSELRLPPDTAPVKLEDVLPKPAVNPVENDLSRNALPYATALAGACPLLAPAANVLPVEHRRSASRRALIPTIALTALLAIAVGGMAVYSKYSERQYLNRIQAEIDRLQPAAMRADSLDKQIARARARALLLDRFRGQTRYDLDSLNELTKLIEPPAWTNSIDLSRDGVRIAGEAPQAAPLINILEASPFFESASFLLNQATPAGEMFQIQAKREARK